MPKRRSSYRMEVLGGIISLESSPVSSSCVATTVFNGAHVFNVPEDFYGTNICQGMQYSRVESYTADVLGDDALRSSCFLGAEDDLLVFGTDSGRVLTVSRQSRRMVSCYTGSDAAPLRQLQSFDNSHVLATSQNRTEIVDVSCCETVCSVENPTRRGVGAVQTSPDTIAVANYDGKVLLYDIRSCKTSTPVTVLSIPDQITAISTNGTGSACVGTAGGRVFTLRCTESRTREEAFGVGKIRSPVCSLVCDAHTVAAGDLSGRVSIISTTDVPDPTIHYSLADLVPTAAGLTNSVYSPNTMEQQQEDQRRAALASEVTGVALLHGCVWAAFTSSASPDSQLLVLPA